jgi:AcrR family transcriptional regulator
MLSTVKDVKDTGAKRTSPTRRERAKATAATIVEAATTEFEANGYQGTTMAMIAARAGVAVQTVHFVFHTKGELLTAAVSNAVLGAGERTPPERSEWFLALMAEPDPNEVLRGFVNQGGPILVRASGVNEVARSAALTDPDAAAAFAMLERLRRDSYRSLLENVATKGTFREGLDIESATDVLFTLMSPRTYLSLTRDQGWSPVRALAWIADIVPLALLQPPTPA